MMHSQKFKAAFTDADEAPRTLVEGAYLQVRRDIIEGRLVPGEKLRVEHLKDRYGIGAGTLREALALLLSDALVIAEGQRGFHVAPISVRDLKDITHMRVLLETHALRQSIAKGDDEWEAGVVAAFHKLSNTEERLGHISNVREWEQRNRAFHESLIAACDSRWECYMIGILYRQSERYRHLAIVSKAVPRNVHNEHTKIFEAALKRDAETASHALEQHIRLTFDSINLLVPELS
ncbi:MAG: FCD domain-containing protein [Thiotrichaceae bacterium]|nr:FCD domain-containing protein [Thiotrichaceae bacterium]